MKKNSELSFDKWLRDGLLARQRVPLPQVEKLLGQAVRDLETARANLSIAEEATYLFAYLAMLRTGRAILFLYGFRPKGMGQHKTVVEVSGMVLGQAFRDLTASFEKMRRKRNELTYEVGGLLSRSDAERALATAREFVRIAGEVLKKENPQLKFNF